MAAGATHVRVLGPFELVHDGQVMPVGGPVGQAIVTVLACRPDTKVLPAELITMVWGDPDAASSETLYSHVTRLRRVLGPAGLAIVGHRPGYRLPVAAEQVDLARRKGLYSQGGLAAKPGTSEHGWGLSLDLDLDSTAQTWMRRHGGEYGFAENVPREPWHWTFKPTQ